MFSSCALGKSSCAINCVRCVFQKRMVLVCNQHCALLMSSNKTDKTHPKHCTSFKQWNVTGALNFCQSWDVVIAAVCEEVLALLGLRGSSVLHCESHQLSWPNSVLPALSWWGGGVGRNGEHGLGTAPQGWGQTQTRESAVMVNLWCNLSAAGFHLKVNIDKSSSPLISWLPV